MRDTNKDICNLIEVGQVEIALEQALRINNLIGLSYMIQVNSEAYKVRIKDLKTWFSNGSKIIEQRLGYYNEFSEKFVKQLTK